MTRVRGSIEIHRRVEEVFDCVADQRNEVFYNPKITESVKLTEGPIGVGTRFRATVLSRGKPLQMTIGCIGLDRPHRLASRTVMAGSVIEGELRCQPVPAGTRFSWNWEVPVSGAARFAGPLIGWVGPRKERAILGLQVTIIDFGHPVVWTVFTNLDHTPVTASLRLP